MIFLHIKILISIVFLINFSTQALTIQDIDFKANNTVINYKDGYNILIYKIHTNEDAYELEGIKLKFLNLEAFANKGFLDKNNTTLLLNDNINLNLNDWHLTAKTFSIDLKNCNDLYGTDLTIAKNNVAKITAKILRGNIATKILNVEGEVEACIKLPNL